MLGLDPVTDADMLWVAEEAFVLVTGLVLGCIETKFCR